MYNCTHMEDWTNLHTRAWVLVVFFLQVVPCRLSFEAFEEIFDLAKSKEIAIFLDYIET